MRLSIDWLDCDSRPGRSIDPIGAVGWLVGLVALVESIVWDGQTCLVEVEDPGQIAWNADSLSFVFLEYACVALKALHLLFLEVGLAVPIVVLYFFDCLKLVIFKQTKNIHGKSTSQPCHSTDNTALLIRTQ